LAACFTWAPRSKRTLPSILQDHLSPLLEPILVDGIPRINNIKQYVIEQRLKSRHAGALHGQKRGQRICAGNADSQYLPQTEDKPEIPGLEKGQLLAPALLLGLVVVGERDLTAPIGTGLDDLGMAMLDW
jgi:hypothetical protein